MTDVGWRRLRDVGGDSGELVRQVVPVWVVSFDQGDLPVAVPAFEALFVGDAVGDRVAAFGPDEAVQSVAAAEVRSVAGAMLVDAGGEMRGDADVERAVVAVAHDVDPAAAVVCHAGMVRTGR